MSNNPRVCPECGADEISCSRTLIVRETVTLYDSDEAALESPFDIALERDTETVDADDDWSWRCAECDFQTDDPTDFIDPDDFDDEE